LSPAGYPRSGYTYSGWQAPQQPKVDPRGRQYADWGTRAVGSLIDATIEIVGVIVLIAFAVAGSHLRTAADPITGDTKTSPLGGLIIFVCVLGIVALLLSYQLLNGGQQGQTLGKRAMNIRCCDAETGDPISYPRALGRYLVRFVGIVIPFGGWIDLLWPLWDDKGQTLHDKAVGTAVVKLASAPSGPPVPSSNWSAPNPFDRAG
jgi:uncharacterized RDD family membrane protein YckC